jgi:3-phenylpropionate/cinnamic acid dioxygenase small subunit
MNDLIAQGRELLWQEAACLDDRRWDEWLDLYTPDCEYWLPTWLSEETLSGDPSRELAHIYYASRAGLEDRVLRIRSGTSPASRPLRRTTHMIGAITARSVQGQSMELRSSWTCHVFEPLHQKTYLLFGLAETQLRLETAGWKIARKKIVVNNDYLPAMIDIYCV